MTEKAQNAHFRRKPPIFADSPLLEIQAFGGRRKLQKTADFRSRPGKPNQRKDQNKKFMNFAQFCEFWCLSLGKQARFTLNFCSGMPLRFMNCPSLVWFAGATPEDFRRKPQIFAPGRKQIGLRLRHLRCVTSSSA